jgi:predicted RNase H-like HicB family nuclease
MTLDELKQMLKEIYKTHLEDPERAHQLADEAILEYIADPKVTNWYARIKML